MSTALELRVAWEQHVGTGTTATAWFDGVVARYRDSPRHYHDVRHLTWVVRHVLDFARRGETSDTGAVVVAAFFHDAVYDPRSTSNETDSAALADRALTEIGWMRARIDHVAALVEATTAHDVGVDDADTACLLAADLAVLAAEPARYADYATAVRREYAHVSDDGWRSGRAAVLRGFLDRPNLFPPSLRLTAWEARARANITAELATLA